MEDINKITEKDSKLETYENHENLENRINNIMGYFSKLESCIEDFKNQSKTIFFEMSN
jgi:hypothetical protein